MEGRIERERNRGVLEEHQVVELYLLVFHVCTMSCGLRGENSERGGAEEKEERTVKERSAMRRRKRGKRCMYAVDATNLLVFQVCRVSGSCWLRSAACTSRKSQRYLIAFGSGCPFGMLKMALNRSST